jgi:hypothetical protein
MKNERIESNPSDNVSDVCRRSKESMSEFEKFENILFFALFFFRLACSMLTMYSMYIIMGEHITAALPLS